MGKWRKISNGEPVKQPPHIVLIFEDVMGDTAVRDKIIDKLAGLARHYYCCIYILVQDPKIITPKVRQNADIAAFTYQTMDRTIDSIYDDYAGIIGNKWVFRDMLNTHTQDHKLVVVDQSEAKYRPEDMFYQDAPKLEVEDFKIGDKEFWNESNCSWEEQVEKFKKLPPNDTKHWKKLLKVRWKDDKKNQEDEATDKVITNEPALGGPEVYQEYSQKLKEKYKLEKSASEEASELLSKIFHYRNGLSIHE